MRPLLAGLAFMLGGSASGADVTMRARTFEIDATTPILQESIVSAYKRWTNINLPEEYVSVMCGDCIDLEEGMDEKEMLKDPRRWLLTKNPKGPSLHIRPLELPSMKMRPESYSTEIYIVLKGGYRINLQVGVIDITKGLHDLAADSVITITAPNSVLLSGRMREELDRRDREQENRKPQENAEVLAENLMGLNECKTVHWKVPYQSDRTVVRLHQLCATNGEKTRAFWAIFSVENLDDARLYLHSAILAPANSAAAPLPPSGGDDKAQNEFTGPPSEAAPKEERPRVGQAFRFAKTELRREEATSGIAVTTLDSKEPVPSEWKLLVMPHATDRAVVGVDGIRY
jgi:hypothetical protein